MKKFKFTLENVMTLKLSIEENEKSVLADLKAKQTILVDERRVLEDEYIEVIQKKRNILKSGTTPIEMLQISNYAKEVQYRIDRKNEEIKQLAIEIEKQVEVVKQAATEVKTLEKLKEKQLQDYNVKAAKEIEIAIEEFVSNKVS